MRSSDTLKLRSQHNSHSAFPELSRTNLPHLRARLVDSGFLDEAEPFDLETLKGILNKRFDEIDYTSAKEDVRSFIRDKASLDLWSANFFKQMTEQLEGQ